jgi:hypothetical protein
MNSSIPMTVPWFLDSQQFLSESPQFSQILTQLHQINSNDSLCPITTAYSLEKFFVQPFDGESSHLPIANSFPALSEAEFSQFSAAQRELNSAKLIYWQQNILLESLREIISDAESHAQSEETSAEALQAVGILDFLLNIEETADFLDLTENLPSTAVQTNEFIKFQQENYGETATEAREKLQLLGLSKNLLLENYLDNFSPNNHLNNDLITMQKMILPLLEQKIDIKNEKIKKFLTIYSNPSNTAGKIENVRGCSSLDKENVSSNIMRRNSRSHITKLQSMKACHGENTVSHSIKQLQQDLSQQFNEYNDKLNNYFTALANSSDITIQFLGLLNKLIAEYELNYNQQNAEFTKQWLAGKSDFIYLKNELLGLERENLLYSKDEITALQMIRREIQNKLQLATQEINAAQCQLTEYERNSAWLGQYVAEFVELSSVLEQKQWTLQQLQ